MTQCSSIFLLSLDGRWVSSGETATVVLGAILNGEATLLLSVPLAFQYEAVLTRPEHLADSGATPEQIARLLDTLCAICKPVEISYLWRPVLRDADDEMVLETAVN